MWFHYLSKESKKVSIQCYSVKDFGAGCYMIKFNDSKKKLICDVKEVISFND